MPPSSPDILPEDKYLDQFLGAMAIEFALRTGYLDQLHSGGALPATKGATILAALLRSAGVIEGDRLSADFAQVLASRRGILVQKLRFLKLAATDVVLGFDDLLGDLPAFMRQSETFKFFRYDQAMDDGRVAVENTRPWVEYVSELSEVEGPSLAPHLPLDGVTTLLEVGGNSGVFARHVLRQFSSLKIGILDLPAVCRIGREAPGDDRLELIAGDARKRPWPEVFGARPEAVLFKSVLHDWPEERACEMLDAAMAHVPTGGRVIICERGPFDGGAMPFSMTANLVFAPFYRPHQFYVDALRDLGAEAIQTTHVTLDMEFFITWGIKP